GSRVDELSGGLGAEFIAGLAGVVLGVLSLIDISPSYLLPVSAIVFGAALLIGTGVVARVNESPTLTPGEAKTETWDREVTANAAGMQIFIGLATMALGILALIIFDWTILTLVALLCVGAATFVSGATLANRLQTVMHHHVHH